MPSYVPHTSGDIARMLSDLGLSSVDDLFACVPEALRLAGGLDIPPGLAEPDVASEMARLARKNRSAEELVCFAGGGAYDHDVPAVTRALASRSEFVTAYTPYQPEVAQGVLQALFEYQTLVSRLAGLPVANASLYDGATALVEAVNLAAAATGRRTVWLSQGVNPRWRDVLRTLTAGTGAQIVDIALRDGQTDWSGALASLRSAARPTSSAPGFNVKPASESAPGAVVVASPNYLGCIDPIAPARSAAGATGALLVCAFDPVAAGLLRSPGEQGADVAVAEGQPLGTPLAFGGPYLGMFAVGQAYVRRLPGRLVGRGADRQGKTAYVTTLRAREQDIRREKASSNICTNQTLVAIAAMVQLSWLGPHGLRELALRCARGTRYARESLLAIPGVRPLVSAPVVREFAVELPVPPEAVIERMAEEGFLAGLPVSAEGRQGLLVAVTEKRTRAQVDAYAKAMSKVISAVKRPWSTRRRPHQASRPASEAKSWAEGARKTGTAVE
ncbi:MAG: aminomethyl-transferring glycine dehydrogenase subunit GcvPA [Acidimicrobiales bacterium]